MRTPGPADPIGVFDSGIGGLTVLEALRRRMPRERLIYFGDTAHVPYGSKSRETVARYSIEAARFLSGRGIKCLVVACNTASALALGAVRRWARVPVVGVIRPGARAAARATRAGRIGIIGTEATIASKSYPRALRLEGAGGRWRAAACPLFVPLVEEGWWSHPVTREVARRYLSPLRTWRADTLILGCTHYPLLKPTLAAVMGPGVRLIDSAEETARETEGLLRARGLARSAGNGSCRFFVSDAPARFRRLARRFMRAPVERVSVHRYE